MVITKLGLRRVAHLLGGVGPRLGREINPHIMTRDEFTGRKRAGDHFVSAVVASPKLFVKGPEHELAAMGQ
jgi:hypothetical protein